MQEVFEKIIERLEKIGNIQFSDFTKPLITVEDAVKIVNQAAAEYNGWIPVGDRLPEDGIDVLVWFEYFRYGDYNRLFQTTGISYTYHGEWSGFVNGQSGWRQLRIIAWRPLPEPYQPKGE